MRKHGYRIGLAALCLSLLAAAAVPAAQAAAPTVATKPADHIGATHAQLHGSVDPEGEATVYWFQYGPADCASNPCTAVPADEEAAVLGTGTEALFISQVVLGLQPETTYHFRILAKNASGTTPGLDETFTTPAAPGPGEACANESLREDQHATFLSDCRAYELVSPADKNGTNVIPDTGRTRAAADGTAVGFISLGAFADAVGTGVGTDYVAERSASGPGPTGTGWSTHAITPFQQSLTFAGILAVLEPLYQAEFTPDLAAGVFRAASPLTADPDVAKVQNLYLRTDLRTPGAGAYQLLTACPVCAETGELSAPTDAKDAYNKRPWIAAISADHTRAAFKSRLRLTKDASNNTNPKLYEWEDGTVGLAGRVPSGATTECDDQLTPVCVASTASIAGQNNEQNIPLPNPHVLSNRSDGHSRLFFTRPTEPTGTSVSPEATAGQLYVREDGHRTIKLSVSERATPTAYRAATYWDASPDGTRAFFSSEQALTESSPDDERLKLYMWSLAPDGENHHLTYIGTRFGGMIGSGGDGHYVYFIAAGSIDLWHDGTISYVGPAPADGSELIVSEGRQARVSPDGGHLLFAAVDGDGLLGYDQHGSSESCLSHFPGECRELYLYDASSSTPGEPDLRCVSCNPFGDAPAGDASLYVRTLNGGAQPESHRGAALVEGPDGHLRAFFSTSDALVLGDTNDKSDAYEYDASTEEAHLLSSGTAETNSWFMDASADGSDAFIVTAQRLVGWDHDSSYDLYDVRVDGGLPEPPPVPAPCQGEACPEPATSPPPSSAVGSTLEGPGNPVVKRPKCPKGTKAKKVKGKTRCVKPHRHRKHHRRAGAKHGGRK